MTAYRILSWVVHAVSVGWLSGGINRLSEVSKGRKNIKDFVWRSTGLSNAWLSLSLCCFVSVHSLWVFLVWVILLCFYPVYVEGRRNLAQGRHWMYSNSYCSYVPLNELNSGHYQGEDYETYGRVNNQEVLILIDSGASHSFASQQFCVTMGDE